MGTLFGHTNEHAMWSCRKKIKQVEWVDGNKNLIELSTKNLDPPSHKKQEKSFSVMMMNFDPKFHSILKWRRVLHTKEYISKFNKISHVEDPFLCFIDV